MRRKKKVGEDRNGGQEARIQKPVRVDLNGRYDEYGDGIGKEGVEALARRTKSKEE